VLDEASPIEEEHRIYDRDGYAIAKWWQERLVRRCAEEHGWRATILRPGFIWGQEHEEIAGAGHSFGPVQMVVGWRRPIPLTYVENCVDCFARALGHEASGVHVFNVVDNEPPSAWRYVGRARREGRVRGVRVYVPYWSGLAAARIATGISKFVFREGGKLPSLLTPRRFEARFRPLKFSNRKAQETLGWSPRWRFDEAWNRMQRRGDARMTGDHEPQADPAIVPARAGGAV
jgi:UDP-glucose 4-epimerase